MRLDHQQIINYEFRRAHSVHGNCFQLLIEPRLDGGTEKLQPDSSEGNSERNLEWSFDRIHLPKLSRQETGEYFNQLRTN